MDDITKQLKLFYQNTRGLRTKTNEFYNNLLLLDSELIMITETWLCDGILDSELCDDRFVVFRKDRKSLGGGVMIMCAPRLQARARPEWQNDDLECVWVTIPARALGSAYDLHVATVYIPPNSQVPSRVQLLLDMTSQIRRDHSNDHFIISGDFNLPCVDWRNSEPIILKKGSVELQVAASNLITQFTFMGMVQYNNLLNKSSNTLDLVFADSHITIEKSIDSLVKADSFHPPFSIIASEFLTPLLKPQDRIKYIFRRADFKSINESLFELEWTFITDVSNDIEDVMTTFYSILNTLIQAHVPQTSCSSTYIYPIWYSRPLIRLINEKIKYHKLWKRYNNPVDYVHFAELRGRQKEMQTICYQSYIKFSQQRIKIHPKFFWSYVKSKRKNSSNYPQQMTYNDTVINTHSDICSAFNNFFGQNFNNPDNNYSLFYNDAVSQTQTIHDIQVTAENICKLLQNLDVTKGAGSDNIPPVFFIKCAKTLSLPISLIFNRCLKAGYFPNIWKKAHIVPIHKKSQKTAIENYRPISILNVLSKLFEKVVHACVYPVISTSLPIQQHGFMKARSTTTNLGVFIDHVMNGMDGGSQVDVIYTDFEKAFDRVDHIILLSKLYKLGIHGNLLRWMESYLRNRSQAVVVGGFCSNFIKIPSGVPQGSILGPLLYASYLYDIGNCFEHARFLMYADDIKVYMKIKNPRDSINLQADLDKLGVYYAENRIGINISKCSYISFTRKKYANLFDYKINNVVINKLNSVRDLGVKVDSKLTFSEHIDSITNKAYKNLGFIFRVTQPFSDVGCLKMLYYSYVRSVLEYCSTVWNPQYITYVQNLENIQNKFVKHLNFRSYRHFRDYQEACLHHHLMTLENRRSLADMCLLHGLCNSYIDCPELSSRLLRFCVPARRTRHTSLFAVTQTHTNYAQNALVNRLHRVYNKKFYEIDVFHENRETFKRDIVKELTNNSN